MCPILKIYTHILHCLDVRIVCRGSNVAVEFVLIVGKSVLHAVK